MMDIPAARSSVNHSRMLKSAVTTIGFAEAGVDKQARDTGELVHELFASFVILLHLENPGDSEHPHQATQVWKLGWMEAGVGGSATAAVDCIGYKQVSGHPERYGFDEDHGVVVEL